MKRNGTIYLSMTLGSIIGGFIPNLWGANIFSVSVVLLSAIGGFLGIWVGYTISQLE